MFIFKWLNTTVHNQVLQYMVLKHGIQYDIVENVFLLRTTVHTKKHYQQYQIDYVNKNIKQSVIRIT